MALWDITIPTDETEISDKFGNSLINLNEELFSSVYPYKGTAFPQIILHCVFGQLPNVRSKKYNIDHSELDLRFHSTIFSPSGTNKGSGFSYASKLCEEVGLKLKPMGQFTDSGLTGFPDGKNNKKKKNDDDDDKPESYIGDLHPNSHLNILAWSEATEVYDVRKFGVNQATMTILQKVMNPIGSADHTIWKTTGLGSIPIESTVSILMTTYKPVTLTTEVLGTGMLQRQFIMIHEPTKEESEEISVAAASKLTRISDYTLDLEELADRLQIINEFIKEKELFAPDEILPHIEEVTRSFYKPIEKTNFVVQEKLLEFARRWSVGHLYTVMFHHAMMRLDTEIKIEDVLYAKDFLLPLWYKLIAYLESALVTDSKEYKIVITRAKDIINIYVLLCPPNNAFGWVSKKELISALSDHWNISSAAAEFRLSEFENSIFESMKKHSKMKVVDSDIKIPSPTYLKIKREAMDIL